MKSYKEKKPAPNRSSPRVGLHRRHVALLVETSLGSGRDILKGIARYLREHSHWAVFHEPRSLEESIPTWLRRWQGEGIIARIQNRKMADAVLSTGLPVVDVLGMVPGSKIPLVHVDDSEIAHLASEHLLERGFRHFGFFGIQGENWSSQRRDGFARWVKNDGCDLSVYERPRHADRRRTWEAREDELADWIARLPKPVGVMVCSDQRGPDFLEACRRAEVEVPDEVAVIGVDNDESLCEVSYPPLSSVWPAHGRVGYEAAALLDQMMSGQPPPEKPVLIAPAGVRTRHSTEVLAIEDRNLAKALRIIREQGCEPLSVDEVARFAGLSRSVLQRRFRCLLGKTVHEEIVNVRVKRASRLMVETDLPLIDIAEKAGFKHQEYMGCIFKARLGKTPAQLRREVRI